jgi:hypothetical protein
MGLDRGVAVKLNNCRTKGAELSAYVNLLSVLDGKQLGCSGRINKHLETSSLYSS